MNHSTLRRGKIRYLDPDLATTRQFGAGWYWKCDCGEPSPRYATRDAAKLGKYLHQADKHGQK